MLVCAVAGVLVVAAAYLVSPASHNTHGLRVVVETEITAPQVTGYRAKIMNEGLLPVFVTRCETTSDALYRDIRVGDALQRRQFTGAWETVVHRNSCATVPTGVIEAKLSRKLLWPTQTLHTSAFFPSVGFANSPFRHGDELRFLIFVNTVRDAEALSSPDFKIQ
jgi:hypothetical protein